jgi:hypothetical protein
MSRTHACCLCLAALTSPAALILVSGPVWANQPPGKSDQSKNRKPRAPNAPASPNKEAKPAVADANLLSMELKALRVLRALEATPHQIGEIARAAKTTAGQPGQREPAKVSDAYVEAMTHMRRALIANDENKIEQLRVQFDQLEDKSPPDLDDEVEVTDGAEIEAVRLLNIFSARQIIAYAQSLEDDFPEPVQLIVEGLEEGRSLKGQEWETARNKLAEEVGWLVCGLQGDKATKLEEQVSAFLDRKHAQEAGPGRHEAEIRKLLGSPGPVVVLKNLMEHTLAELLSNPQLERAAKDCLRQAPHGEPHGNPAQVAATKPAPPAPITAKGDAKRPGRPQPKTSDTPARQVSLDEVLKSPADYQGQEVQFDHLTVTGTAPGKAPANLWLAVKTGSGTVVAASRDQKLTFVIPIAKTPKAIQEMSSGDGKGISVTLTCMIRRDAPQHWIARVQSVHENK